VDLLGDQRHDDAADQQEHPVSPQEPDHDRA
jgi:hypothetical protein